MRSHSSTQVPLASAQLAAPPPKKTTFSNVFRFYVQLSMETNKCASIIVGSSAMNLAVGKNRVLSPHELGTGTPHFLLDAFGKKWIIAQTRLQWGYKFHVLKGKAVKSLYTGPGNGEATRCFQGCSGWPLSLPSYGCFFGARGDGGVDIFRFQKNTWSRFCRGVWKVLPVSRALWQSLLSSVIEPSAQWRAQRIHCVTSLPLGGKGGTIQTPFSGNRKQGTRVRKNLLSPNLILAPSFSNMPPHAASHSSLETFSEILIIIRYLSFFVKSLLLRSSFTVLLLPRDDYSFFGNTEASMPQQLCPPETNREHLPSSPLSVNSTLEKWPSCDGFFAGDSPRAAVRNLTFPSHRLAFAVWVFSLDVTLY